jgi:hypothetical protein
MRVDIRPYWKNLTNWYWDESQNNRGGFSIWEILEEDYGARCVHVSGRGFLMEFPDEKAYMLFVLRWS